MRKDCHVIQHRFILRPLADTALPMTLGNAFYTAFLQLVGEHDPELAT